MLWLKLGLKAQILSKMNCPYCNHAETKVIDSRESKDGSAIKRRRECLSCEKRFSTVEKVQKLDLEVEKASGEVQEFNIQKIRSSLLKACEKRPVTLEQIEKIIESILTDLKQIDTSTIPTKIVGRIVLKNLKKVDEMAFLKYAIVHNNYGSIDEFTSEIATIKNIDKLN